ncbi:MAG: DUF4838 domain-containing protein [Kiritimatiellia bacterium]
MSNRFVMHSLAGIMTGVLVIGLAACTRATRPALVHNGQPRAAIVVAAEQPRMVSLAAMELQHYLEKISGARLPVVTEPSTNYPCSIYVGQSPYTDQLGVNAEGLKYGAYRMVSVPNGLVLLGSDFDFVPPEPWPAKRGDVPQMEAQWDAVVGTNTATAWVYPFRSGFKSWWNPGGFTQQITNRYGADVTNWWDPGTGFSAGIWLQDEGGSLNAVYAFLNTLGARWYMPGELGEVIPILSTITLPDLNETVKPDFDMRAYFWYNYAAFPFEDMIWARRMGANSGYETLGNIGHAHGLHFVHSRKEMQEAHPEYYALRNGERVTDYRGMGHVCFASEGLFRETVNFARFMFDRYNAPHFSLWPVDGFHHCQCDVCREIPSSDLVWGFVDRVARELYKTHPDRMISCGAYTPYIQPPKTVEKFTPNVAVFIANAGRPLMDDPERWKAYWKRVEGWQSKVAPGNILRVENNRYGLARQFPIIHPRNMVKDLQALKGISRGENSEESQSQARWHSPGLDHLTLYVQSRFFWDADQDLDTLLGEYYTLFYGPVALEMRAALEFAETHYSRTDTSRNGGRCDPQNVPTADRVRLGELLQAARAKAGDTIYGQRIQVIIDELPPLDDLRAKLAEEQQAGNPRADAPVVTARPLNSSTEAERHHINKNMKTSQPADQDAAFSVAWDQRALVFDIVCQETNMAGLCVADNVWEGDSVLILLESPSHSYYQIEINPDGKVFDADRSGGGLVVTRWASMTDVKTERGADSWRVTARIPIAIVGQEGAEGDPMNYVVAPELSSGAPWYFNIGRRRVRNGEKTEYIFNPTRKYTFQVPDKFARLNIE